VSRDDIDLDVRELRGFLLGRLPDYMVPTLFIGLKSFPLTPNGKVDRRALPTPEEARTGQITPFVAPRTPIEEKLASILADALQVERVGAHDSFFDLGGHSLLATQVLGRIRDAFHTNLSLQSVFDAPTVAGIAAALDDALQHPEAGQTPSIVASNETEIGKL